MRTIGNDHGNDYVEIGSQSEETSTWLPLLLGTVERHVCYSCSARHRPLDRNIFTRLSSWSQAIEAWRTSAPRSHT